LGRLYFSTGNFSQALRHFCNALRTFPNCPPEVRLGIAACYLRLGEVPKAEAAYRRVLELDPGATQALLGLAVMELAVGASAEATQRGSRLLAQAFREDPHNPHALALLAHFSLQQGLAAPALRLATAAMARVDVDDKALRAEVTALLGRAHHANGELSDALQCYKKALSLDPNLPTVKLAKAQLDVLRGDFKTSVEALESVLDARPEWTDALRILAPLCPRTYAPNVPVPSARHFKEAAEKEFNDAALWEMLGDVLSGFDPATALSAYTTSINLHRKASNAAATTSIDNGNGVNTSTTTGAAAIPARLLNNAAVLQLRAGNPTAASQLLAESIASAVGGGLSELGPQAQVTLGYNSARVREAGGDLNTAESEYKALLAQFPDYSDCYLRLACIYQAKGDIKTAEEWAQRAAEVSSRSADALALLANLHLARGDIEAAKRYLEELQDVVTKDHMKNQPYARVALGNVHLYAIAGDLKKEDHCLRAEYQLAHALFMYMRVLDKYPGDIFAANGIGCVLAECGRLSEAKEVFLSVQEAAAGTDGFVRLPDAWVNLAGVYMGLEEFTAAEQTYINAMKRFPEVRDNARVRLYLAKAQYDGGRGEAALRTLCHSVYLAPQDPRMRFNLAYVLQQLGFNIVSKRIWVAGDGSKVEKVKIALRRLRAAHENFSALLRVGQESSGISNRVLEKHLKFVEGVINDGTTVLTNFEAEARASALRLESNRLKLEHDALKRRQQEENKKLEQEALLKQQEKQAQATAAKLELMKSEWKQGDKLAKAAAAGDASAIGKGRQSAANGGGGGGGGGGQRGENPDAALDALFADESDDEEFIPGQEGDNSGGEEEEERGAAPLEGTAALAAAGLLSSEDEDEDFDFPAEGEDSEKEEKKSAKKMKEKKPKEKKGGRLKKRGREAENEEAAPADGEGEEEDGAAKRARQAAVLEDSDDEEEGGDGAPINAKPSTDDLFGSDSE
jgi:RNA polymerase-associated protein CTR9